ncbi:hypothetical protein FH972_021094 [Carpinus fangiana]|uniref:Cyclin N-terminal domain-containing protein n=1 Tax=Carpinus fangiana TaxID=176857 RepID=A0A5N6KNX2_9ROSI|nr:hypothetical protein FH972_021094 [Carpinus fangiana]
MDLVDTYHVPAPWDNPKYCSNEPSKSQFSTYPTFDLGRISSRHHEDDTISSSGSDSSDQSEAFSQLSDGTDLTDITEPDRESSVASSAPGLDAQQSLALSKAEADQIIQAKLAALDRKSEDRHGLKHGAYASNVPVGHHRSALSLVDSINQTRSQRFPVPCAAKAPTEWDTKTPHPRRSAPAVQCKPPSLQRSGLSHSWSPPSLVREDERRKVMVEQLVETASELIAALWPASVSLPGGSQGSVISLPFFVRETLRRSRTSYNSLQVALYYIVKLKAKGKLPTCDLGKDQSKESQALRAMQCGRRMLLTSLILASKYLQDRNFSARAWSKISGLPVDEISSNELAVLQALDWKLHVSEGDFTSWSTVVHKSTEALRTKGSCRTLWQQVIQLYRAGASLEALALSSRPNEQHVRRASQPCSVAAYLPSPASSMDSVQRAAGIADSFEAMPSFATQRAEFTQGMLATPSCSPPGALGVFSSGLPPPAPRLGTNLSTPCFTPLSASSASTPAAFTGGRRTSGAWREHDRISGWTESRMLSPQSLSYSSDEEAVVKTTAGSKRRASEADTDEQTSKSSPPKICRLY